MTIGSRTSTVNESSSATSISGTLPTDRQAGDLAVVLFAIPGTAAQFTGPGGSWVQLAAPTDNGSGETLAAYYQFTPGSAPSASTAAAAGRCTAIVQSYSGVDTTTPVDVAAQITTGSAALTATGVTVATAGARLISGACIDTSSRPFVTPSGMTIVKQYGAASTGRALALADETRASAGASGTRSWDVTPTAALNAAAFVSALRPAAVTFTATAASTTTASGALTNTMGGSSASTTTVTAALKLDAKVTGASASTTTFSGALAVESRVFTGTLEIELEPDSDVWTDFTDRLDQSTTPVAIRYGRPTVYDDVGAGTLTCAVFNDDGALMPDSPGAATPLEEGLRIRWTLTQSSTDYTRFHGWISDLVPDFPTASTTGARIAITAVDALGLLGQRKLRSNWTELALAAARSAVVPVDALEAAGTTVGWQATMTNYSPDAGALQGNYQYNGAFPNLSFTSDRDTSIGPVVSASPDTNGDSNETIANIQSGSKCVQWLIKTPSEIPGVGVTYYVSTIGPTAGSGFNIAIQPNGSTQGKLVVTNYAGSSVLGTLLSTVCAGQWVMIKVTENAGNTSRVDVSATQLGNGTTGSVTSLVYDVKTFLQVVFPSEVGLTAAIACGGVVAFGQRAGLSYEEASVLGAQGAVSSRLGDLQSALSALPVTWGTSGTFTTTCVTGTWSNRTALEVLQELMRTNLLSAAFARPRDSKIYTMGYDIIRPTTVLATIDTDGDCAGPPRLSRAQSTRPTRVQADAPGLSIVTTDTAAEAGPGSPQRLKQLTTVASGSATLASIGTLMLAQRTKLRITQMSVDLTTAVTDHLATLFDESGALTGLRPGARIRAVVPVSHFGVPTRDYWVQGWTESYTSKITTVTLDTDPCTTATYLAETWTAANGTAWSGATWTATFGGGTAGATFDTQSNAGRIVSGGGGSQAGKRIGTTYTDIELTGTAKVTGAAEAQVWWRMDSGGSNGYGLVFSASGGVRLQQAVSSVISTRYNATQVGGPTVVAGTNYAFRIRHQGEYLSVKAWDASGSEPTSWGLDTTDTLITSAGYVGLANWGASLTSTFDTFTITDGA